MAHIEISESMMINIVTHDLRELLEMTIESRDELLARYGDLERYEHEDLIHHELQIAALGMVLKMYGD